MSRSTQPRDVPLKRISPLDHVLKPGRYGGGGDGEPGVRLAVRHPRSIVTMIARKDQAEALSAAVQKQYGVACPGPGHSAEGRDVTVHWAGPEQWFVAAGGREEGALYDELGQHLAGISSLSDQSHGRITLAVSGPHARDVLAKGTPVDLHPRAFGEGRCAVTQMAHVGVHLAQTGPDDFELSLFRGFAESFWEWLTEMSLEFGYQIDID